MPADDDDDEFFAPPRYFFLDEKNKVVAFKPMPGDESGVLRWGKLCEDFNKRLVAETVIEGGPRVSTIFMGLDHDHIGMITRSHDPSYEPLVFETMVFHKLAVPRKSFFAPGRDMTEEGREQWRWRSHADAIEGHKNIVEALIACGDRGLPDDYDPLPGRS